MTEAPPAIVKLAADFAARPDRPRSYVMAGIVGDAAHMSPPEGYHVSARDEHFNWGAYSLATARDQAGARRYPDYASAWDLHFDTADMELVTGRLLAAAKNPNDHRLDGVAEFAGTTDGHVVHAYYNNTKTDDPIDSGGWDSGHLSHVHLSISRDDCNNYAALAPILDVLCGVPLTTDPLEEVMAFYASKAEFEADLERLAITAVAKFLLDPEKHQFGVYTIVKEAVRDELVEAGLVKAAA